MSPIHVIVGDDPRAEAMWASAFTGAVDLYRFDRNVDAFERLTAAQAPIDLVVLTPAQRGPFNLTPDQFIARLLEGPLGSSRLLSNLHVIVVGQPVQRQHPRVMAVSTLDAAIRLVKFGELELTPRPQVAAPPAPERVSRRDMASEILDVPFAGSVISRIWDAPDPTPSPSRDERPAATPQAQPLEDDRFEDDVVGGGPEVALQQPTASTQLFTRSAPAGFVAAGGQLQRPHGNPPVEGGGAAVAGEPAQVGAPGESIEVATGTLQAARPYDLPGNGAYRGPSMRGGAVLAASHPQAGGQPVPPALASQVHSMVYGNVQVGNPHDPIMVWSSTAREGAAPAPDAAPVMQQQVPMQQAAPVTVQVAQPMASPVRTVPMEPPAGVYGGVAPQHAQPQPPQQADPFLARAEQAGGSVSFG